MEDKCCVCHFSLKLYIKYYKLRVTLFRVVEDKRCQPSEFFEEVQELKLCSKRCYNKLIYGAEPKYASSS